jgi:hypothetical protein
MGDCSLSCSHESCWGMLFSFKAGFDAAEASSLGQPLGQRESPASFSPCFPASKSSVDAGQKT